MSFWRNRSVLVTGATGLLGSWLTEELLRRQAIVTCIVRDWVSESRLVTSGLIDRTNVARGNLEDYDFVLRVVNEYEVDTLFHLGAQTIVSTASRSPISTFESNVRGTWTVLEACRSCPKILQRVVVASSDKAYGAHETLPYKEDTPLQGRFPYDVSKSCADLIAISYFQTYRVPLAITRCGNLYGGGDLNFSRLVPGTIRSALLDEAPIIRSDGTLIRDYFYVRDAVDAYLHLAERLREDELTGHAFNFGTETPVSVIEMVEAILKTMSKTSLKPRIMNEASHEIPRQYLDCSKARELLEWRPRYGQQEALAETVAWYRRHFAESES